MSVFFGYPLFHTLFCWLPPWFEICCALIIVFFLVVALFRLVAFVLDVLPFA